MDGSVVAVAFVQIAELELQELGPPQDGIIITQYATLATNKGTKAIHVPFVVKLIEPPLTEKW